MGDEPDADQRLDAAFQAFGPVARGRRSGVRRSGAVEVGDFPPLRGVVGGADAPRRRLALLHSTSAAKAPPKGKFLPGLSQSHLVVLMPSLDFATSAMAAAVSSSRWSLLTTC